MFRKIWLSFKSVKNLHTLVLDLLGLIKGDVIYYLWNGLKFTARAGTSDISEIIINNADSEYPSYFFPKNNNPIIIDAGANIGDTTLFIYQKLKLNKPKIYALEPNSQNFQYLAKNIKLNKAAGVSIFKVALTGSTGSSSLNFHNNRLDGGFINGVTENFWSRSEKINTTTLVDFCKNNKITHVDLLKIDIEGSEYSVFKSSKEFLKKNVKTIFVELHNIDKLRNYAYFKKNIFEIGFTIEADIMNRTLFLKNKKFI